MKEEIRKWFKIITGISAVLLGGWLVFIFLPGFTGLEAFTIVKIGVILLVIGIIVEDEIKEAIYGYDVAEIRLRGPIQEDTPHGVFSGGNTIPSNKAIKKIRELKTRDYKAVVVNIDSPGGDPVSSEDIRTALKQLDVPVLTYTRSICASGGYMIACGTDHIHARRDSLIGSIGVIGSQYKMTDLAENIGIDRERFVGGEYKDTLDPFKELSEDERDYFQGIIDQVYENFVGVVASERDLSTDDVKGMEARVFDGGSAKQKGLVDTVGSRQEFNQLLAQEIGEDHIRIRVYDVGKGRLSSIGAMVSVMAYSFGQGLKTLFEQMENPRVQYR